ncbi:hypothetical protein BDB00DRAFT_805401 [Zychaea mexicana]|uniref:uncharacterized protein n=1 Tax=Zychaea mexicana TaxID=64656 RepID=UPI0022FE8D49|nr:uncharacterized protein BDB00DRAFT_805401 [Zychaea mexicana]KAI9497201.1 hypothetical protein BDB00DRAFT_805401 [Zychaea mexicana]
MTEINDYEIERQKNIERNRELLAQFNLVEARSALQQAAPASVKKDTENIPVKTEKRIRKPTKKQADPLPARKSSRLRGIEPPKIQINAGESVQGSEEDIEALITTEDELLEGKLLEADEYFDGKVRQNAYRTDGHYTSWINPELMAKHGFENNAADAWEKNGGGTFSYKDPLGTGKKKGGSRVNAKVVAKLMFKKNPNAYFYRHTEPDVEQWVTEWTEEEKNLFLETAKKYGCGDKWGLFSTYIPHRVGYQCSNFYRSVILPEGLIFDKNYKVCSVRAFER